MNLLEEFARLKADPEAAKQAEPVFIRAFIEAARGYILKRAYRTSLGIMQLFIEHFPKNAEGYTLLGHSYAGLLEDERAIESYETALDIAPSREAYVGLATVYERSKRYDLADLTWRRGFGCGALHELRPRMRVERPIRILVLSSVLPGNLRYGRFMRDSRFSVTTLYAESYTPELTLPAHDLVFNTIGDAELCVRALERAQLLALTVKAPLLNHPFSVAHTGREENARRLGRLENVVGPLTLTVERELLLREDAEAFLLEHGFRYPFLMRSQGYSIGLFFERVESQRDIARVASSLPGEKIIVIQFIDTMKADGSFRKYRMMAIDRRLYPVHLAISRKWKVHYYSANMSDDQAFRDEEYAYLHDAPAVLGPKAMKALDAIVETMDLDYWGIDFTVNDAGEVVVFEANANMVLLLPENAPRWQYRRKPIQNAIDAGRNLILSRVDRADRIFG